MLNLIQLILDRACSYPASGLTFSLEEWWWSEGEQVVDMNGVYFDGEMGPRCLKRSCCTARPREKEWLFSIICEGYNQWKIQYVNAAITKSHSNHSYIITPTPAPTFASLSTENCHFQHNSILTYPSLGSLSTLIRIVNLFLTWGWTRPNLWPWPKCRILRPCLGWKWFCCCRSLHSDCGLRWFLSLLWSSCCSDRSLFTPSQVQPKIQKIVYSPPKLTQRPHMVDSEHCQGSTTCTSSLRR